MPENAVYARLENDQRRFKGLLSAGVCEWSAARVIFFGFWLAMLVSTFVEYRKEKG